jgi:hypothetical protein
MLHRLKMFPAIVLALFVMAPMAHSVVTPIAKITLNETKYEKFGALYFQFTFNLRAPVLFIFCETGVVAGGGGCIGGIELESDWICVTNNVGPNFGEGVVAMLSQPSENAGVILPPDFPCPRNGTGTTLIFLAEKGTTRVLSPTTGFPTTNPDGTPGPAIRVTAFSDLESTTSTTSDTLTVSSQ